MSSSRLSLCFSVKLHYFLAVYKELKRGSPCSQFFVLLEGKYQLAFKLDLTSALTIFVAHGVINNYWMRLSIS